MGCVVKDKRFSMRLSQATFDRLHIMAEDLGAPLSDVLVTGAMLLYARAANPVEYFKAKAESLYSMPNLPLPDGPVIDSGGTGAKPGAVSTRIPKE